MGMSILQRQQYSSFDTTASSSPSHTIPQPPFDIRALYKVKRTIPNRAAIDGDPLAVSTITCTYFPIMLVAPPLSLSPRFGP
jgi:hypothetical protein